MTNRWATDILELRNIYTWLLSHHKCLTSWYCVKTVSWSVVVISIRLGTGTGLVMVNRAIMRTRRIMVMVVRRARGIIVMVMVVGRAVGESGGQRKMRFLRSLSQPKADANAKGEWKSKVRP